MSCSLQEKNMENKEIKDFHSLNTGNVQGKEVFHPSKKGNFEGNRGEMLIRKLMVFLSVILLIGLVSASFEIGNLSHSIEKNYGPKDYIKGWLNISLDEEPSNSIIETNFQDSISLKDLLELNSGFVKTCSTKDCSSDYISNNPQSSEEFELSKGEEV